MEYRCVQCGFPMKTLYVQYSPGNIRLMKCEKCKAVADEYVECEIMILLIDLILHKRKAYRHLLYNVLNQEKIVEFEGLFWKSALCFLLLDAYRTLVLESSKEQWQSSMSFSSLVFTFWKILMDVILGNSIFAVTLLSAAKMLLGILPSIQRYRDLFLAIMISSYFKIFLIAMMVWEFPSSVIFIIDLFVLSSNTVALKVTTESSMSRCIGACVTAHLLKACATQMSSLRMWRHQDIAEDQVCPL